MPFHKSICKERKFTKHYYQEHRPRKVLFSEHVYFVQICPGPVTYYITYHNNSMFSNYAYVCKKPEYATNILSLYSTDNVLLVLNSTCKGWMAMHVQDV